MTENSRLHQAALLLRSAYCSRDGLDHVSCWSRCLRTLFGIAAGHPAEATITGLLASGPLATPSGTTGASAGQLIEILQPVPRGPQKASVVRALAGWWATQFGDECNPDWTGSISTYREALRQIRGLGPAVVDELLLFGPGLAVFPVDRTALRVAVRHGWLDLPVDDEDAQSLFARGADRSVTEMRELSQLLTKVGEEHCGREPQCDGCPLQSMLPEGGPRNPQSC